MTGKIGWWQCICGLWSDRAVWADQRLPTTVVGVFVPKQGNKPTSPYWGRGVCLAACCSAFVRRNSVWLIFGILAEKRKLGYCFPPYRLHSQVADFDRKCIVHWCAWAGLRSSIAIPNIISVAMFGLSVDTTSLGIDGNIYTIGCIGDVGSGIQLPIW
jgi:hypothetical protein